MTKKKLIFTGIGSRETPEPVLDLMAVIAAQMAMSGWTLRSGHAQGADMAFEHGCVTARGRCEIYVPWERFNGASLTAIVGNPEHFEIAKHFHPAWDKCSEAVRKLHARNVDQVVGYNTDTPSNLVICWTEKGKRGGGTGQALRIAEHLEIPIFDLAILGEKEKLVQFVNQLEKTNV